MHFAKLLGMKWFFRLCKHASLCYVAIFLLHAVLLSVPLSPWRWLHTPTGGAKAPPLDKMILGLPLLRTANHKGWQGGDLFTSGPPLALIHIPQKQVFNGLQNGEDAHPLSPQTPRPGSAVGRKEPGSMQDGLLKLIPDSNPSPRVSQKVLFCFV